MGIVTIMTIDNAIKIIVFDPINCIEPSEFSQYLTHITLFCNNASDLRKHYLEHKHSLQVVIFSSTLSESDYMLIKQLKTLNILPEFILLVQKKYTFVSFKKTVMLGIYSIHEHHVHPAILQLDLDKLLEHSTSPLDALHQKILNTQDLELFLMYQSIYGKNKSNPSISHDALMQDFPTATLPNICLDRAIHSIQSFDTSWPHTSAKVLIVEDDMSIANRIKYALKKKTIYCHHASHSSEALRFLETHPDINMILLDICLPTETGDEFLATIQEQYPHLCIIMITAYKDTETLVSCFNHGAYDYLIKPILPDEILERIDYNFKFSMIKTAPPSLLNQLMKTIS